MNQLCLNPKSAGQISDQFCATHSSLKTENQFKQKWVSSSLLHFMSVQTVIFHIILNRRARALSINNPILRFFINNYSTHIDIPHEKIKQLKISELLK